MFIAESTPFQLRKDNTNMPDMQFLPRTADANQQGRHDFLTPALSILFMLLSVSGSYGTITLRTSWPTRTTYIPGINLILSISVRQEPE